LSPTPLLSLDLSLSLSIVAAPCRREARSIKEHSSTTGGAV
jgi:hypothetical protein